MDELTKSDKDWIEHNLRKLDFVQWDRYLTYTNAIAAFGWIEREKDNHKDFVILYFIISRHLIDPVTSSAKYSEQIHASVCEKDGMHVDCRRVEDKFDIRNCIKIGDD